MNGKAAKRLRIAAAQSSTSVEQQRANYKKMKAGFKKLNQIQKASNGGHSALLRAYHQVREAKRA